MKQRTSARRFSALALIATLATLGVIMPVLDMMVGDGGDAVESRHYPDTHGFPHNHLLCIQHQASQWEAASDAPLTFLLAWVALPDLPGSQSLIPAGLFDLPLARGPPTA